MFSFGIAIQNFVKPFLDLFTVAGFAPLLAFCMVTVTLLIGLRVYFWHSRPGKKNLEKVSKVLATIHGQQDFTSRYGEVEYPLFLFPMDCTLPRHIKSYKKH